MKHFLNTNVLSAAQQRISYIFDKFEKICIAFSGGKDSTVMLHLVIDEAIRRNRKVAILFIDWEAQYKLTIKHVKDCFEIYKDYIEPYWICLPLLTTNSCSQFEPEWICWQPDKKHLWVRELPEFSISNQKELPFYYYPMTFEEFIVEFGKWYSQNKTTACFIGIRTQESLNRVRTLNNETKSMFEAKKWTTRCSDNLVNVYPIYDWKSNDIWIYFSKFKKQYNKIYDLMYYAGLTINQMRICEPYGEEQKRGLWLYHLLEPETWGKVVLRVAGANSGALYSNETGTISGRKEIQKPNNHTWESFTKMLLITMPEKTSEHYKNKIAVWMHWYQKRGIKISDELPRDVSSEDMPSWRRVCKVLLKNDYWCTSLCFGPTKSAAYDRYLEIMKKRREKWQLI